jgi:hypothetical protein
MPTQSELRGLLQVVVDLESLGAAAVTGNLPVWIAPNKIQVASVQLVPSAAITADPTNNAVYTLTRHTAGASATTVATRTWAATNSVALTPENMTLSGTAANLLLAAGDTLTAIKTVNGTGLVIPNLLLVVNYRNAGV